MLRQLEALGAGGGTVTRDGQGGTRAVSRGDLESQRMAGTSWGSYARLNSRHPATRSKRVNIQTRQPRPGWSHRPDMGDAGSKGRDRHGEVRACHG